MFSTYKGFSDQLNTLKLLTQIEAYEDGNLDNKKYLAQIIKEAHDLVTNKINEREVSFEVYDVVMKMVEPERENLITFFQEVDPENITHEDFVTLNNVLSSIIDDI